MELTYTAQRNGRFSSFLKNELKISTGLMNRLKWGDALQVNGIAQHTDYAVQPGDVITVRLDEPKPEYPAEDGALSILYEDDFLLAVDKPAGMLIHPSRSQLTGTLANRVVGYYQKYGQKSAFHPVTRLDRDTIGVVLIAKSAHVHALLQTEKAEKTYHALVLGEPPTPEGSIDAPIARKPLPSLLREISPAGKPAVSRYRLLHKDAETAKLALTPITGRTHQLRLHCAYIGCPILGDPQYGTPQSRALSRQHHIETQLLCAKKISLRHPITEIPVEIISKLDVPDDLTTAFG